jgi:hypothetical protein
VKKRKRALDLRPLQESRDHPHNLGIAHLCVIEPWSIDQHHFASVNGERFGELDLGCTRKKVGPYFEVVGSAREVHELSKRWAKKFVRIESVDRWGDYSFHTEDFPLPVTPISLEVS